MKKVSPRGRKKSPKRQEDEKKTSAKRQQSPKSPKKPNKIKDPIEHIFGPVSLTEWKGYGKHIYNFGDWHVRDGHCLPAVFKNVSKKNTLPIDEYIDYVLLNNPDKMIDVFIEESWKSKEQKGVTLFTQDSYIKDVINEFADCLTVSKQNCKYKNARFHYVDVRRYQEFKSFADLYWALHDMVFLTDSGTQIEAVKRARSKFPISINPQYTLPKYIMKQFKIDKQLDAIQDVTLKDKLIGFLNYYFDKSVISTDDLDALIQVFQDPNIETKGLSRRQFDQLPKIWKRYKRFFYLIQDSYLISRIFRSFTPKKKGEYSAAPKFIILYTGEAHKTFYDRLFKKLGMKEIESEESNIVDKNFQCLDISDFNRPFFSK